MAYSTGRGGAGNIKHDTNITSENNKGSPAPKATLVTPSNSNDQTVNGKKIYYSTGRGGAGNIQSLDSIPSPKLVPQGSNTPQLLTTKVSTGRGGYGNMVNNNDPELTRKLQDVDGPKNTPDLHAVASNKSFSVGRGGFGNVVSRTRSSGSGNTRNLNDQTPNLYAISSHGADGGKRGHKRGLLGKIKEFFN